MNKLMGLSPDIGKPDIAKEPIRKGFGRGLATAGLRDERVVALCADLTESTQMHIFRDAFPDRFIEVGVAEQNLVTLAAGLAAAGKIPFASSYAAFSPGRNWEQIRTTICLNDRPVKIAGSHAGLYTGADGATHQMLEDLALMRALPNMVVLAPGDSTEAEKATLAAADNNRPTYLRLCREATPVFTTAETPFEIGRAYLLHEGVELTIASTGTMTYPALLAARMLAADGIRAEVIHFPTVKPLDETRLLLSAQKTGRVLSVEEHQTQAGFGSAVAEVLSEKCQVPLKRLGVNDRFGESGRPEELLKAFGLTPAHIAMSAHQFLDGIKKSRGRG